MEQVRLPSHDDVQLEIEQMHLAVDACELHGALVGFLAGGGQAGPDDWLRHLALDAQVPPESMLAAMFATTCDQLRSSELAFDLLMPDDDTELAERGTALVAWCRGFLAGFGLVAGSAHDLSEEAHEALQDIGRIGASEFSYDEVEADEEALAEIIEYVRVAVLLLQDDCERSPHPQRSVH